MTETVTLYDYLNREDVRKVMNVPTYVPEFRDAHDGLTYYPNFEGSAWIYEIFNKYGYKMLHMMGDTDGILSMKGIWSFINSAKWMKTTKEWTPWVTETENEIKLRGFYKEF